MSEYLLHYDPVNTNSWVYLSSLLMIGLFFKFSRLWSVRNLDLVLLILLAPGLLLVHHGDRKIREEAAALEKQSQADSDTPANKSDNGNNQLPKNNGGESDQAPFRPVETDGRKLSRGGYLWVLVISGFFLARLLADSTMVRRPFLEPNLTTGGIIFIGVSLFLFLMANVIKGPAEPHRFPPPASSTPTLDEVQRNGPGYVMLNWLPRIQTFVSSDPKPNNAEVKFATTARLLTIGSHLAIILGLVVVGFRHFENTKMGLGAALIYLMLPYTAQMTGYVDHVLPAAMLVWAVVCYRIPIVAGIFIGLATGMVYYPLFLLPLWISFYWRKGAWRFVIAMLATLALMAITLAFTSQDFQGFIDSIKQMFGLWKPVMVGLHGIWGLGWSPFYRLPVLALFFVLSGTLAMWPAQKNLGTLICCSAAVMVATQFWHGFGGGMFMAWYLPLTLLTVFRPNLEDRVALSMLNDGWRK